jgi:GDP-L-fucose synthase
MDATKPDGTPRKLLDIGKLAALGWQPSIDLKKGLESTYAWFVGQFGSDRSVRTSSLSGS